jgi:hypothetical protein
LPTFGKTVDVAHLQHDGHCQNVADAGYGQQLPEMPFLSFTLF